MKTRLVVRALIERDGLALVNETKGGPRLLGGRVKKDETLQDALVRELLEEVGCRATVSQVVHVSERQRKSLREITFTFRAVLFGEPVSKEKQIRLGWVSRAEVCGWTNTIKFQAA